MPSIRNGRRTVCALTLLIAAGFAWSARSERAQAAEGDAAELATSFDEVAGPFLEQNCVNCHNAELQTSGIRVDHLDGALEERRLRLWETVRRKVVDETMPPEGAPQPTAEEREEMTAWIDAALDVARSRPTPKNGVVRRLTVAQYRNTLRELLHLEDDLTAVLPPDAVSEDGFVNNVATLELSPLLMEAYFEIAEEALARSIVDPDSKPSIQNFRMDLGEGVNPEPLEEDLILGARSMLLDNANYRVVEMTPEKPFAFEPFRMRKKYRFIEGYQGNATVRGWREFDSIYHAVFADMRGSVGYPKGLPYDMVPEGMLLRPAIPTDELFGSDGTYGPKANFKIPLRELPDHGRFRVTVTAAKYNDGLLLDPGAKAREAGVATVVARSPESSQIVTVPKTGVYQVDLHEAPRRTADPADASRLNAGLAGSWTFDDESGDGLEGGARRVDSPFGRAVSLEGAEDAVVAPAREELNVGAGDFTVAAWIHPSQLKRGGLVARGGEGWTHGWFLATANNRGVLQLKSTGPGEEDNGSVESPEDVIVEDAWQHVAAVVGRGPGATRLYVNGYLVAEGEIGGAELDNPELGLHIGRLPEGAHFLGDLDEVRLYSRALSEAEIQALVEPGRAFALPPPEKPQEVRLSLGGREFSGALEQPAFLAARLEAGSLPVRVERGGVREIDRVVLTPLEAGDPVAKRFETFEQRSPRVGVHLGFRRDCGSTLVPVGPPQTVESEALETFVFEGAIADFPSPEVEENNVNYLAGIRELGVRSEYTDGRDMPRLLVRSVEFEGPLHETWPPKMHQAIFLDSSRKTDASGYAREILSDFASRAYRRPATDDEVAALMGVFERALAREASFRESVKEALLVALTSPQFLFLVEASQTPEPEPLDDYELASKLSYFLWNGPPDERTLELARTGKLRDRLDEEVDRLVEDPRFERFTKQFVSQWLSLEKFDVLEPDREQFPKLTNAARDDLRREPIETVERLIRENLPVRQLVDSDVIVANEVVANYYGLGERTESGFEFVPIAHGRPELGGVLTQAAVMAGLSDGRESNPVKRGAWVARKIVAEPPDPPPPNVPDLSAETEGLSLRERLEQHRSQPGCMQCHMKIDPWGVALEEFNAGGRLKAEPADARSTLPDGTEVSSAEELKQYLSDDRVDQVAFSVLKHLATYATGRSLTYNELKFLKEDGKRLADDGYRMREMVRYVVRSKMFLEK